MPPRSKTRCPPKPSDQLPLSCLKRDLATLASPPYPHADLLFSLDARSPGDPPLTLPAHGLFFWALPEEMRALAPLTFDRADVDEQGFAVEVWRAPGAESAYVLQNLIDASYGKDADLPLSLPSFPPYSHLVVDVDSVPLGFPHRLAAHSDVNLRLQDPDIPIAESRTFLSYRALLAARLPYFSALFSSRFADSASTVLTLPAELFPDITLPIVLHHVYFGTLPLQALADPGALDRLQILHAAADFLGAENLAADARGAMRELAHGFRCGCSTCRAVVGPLAAWAFATEGVAGDTLGVEARAALVKRWADLWGREWASVAPGLRDRVVARVVERFSGDPARVGEAIEGLALVRGRGIRGAWGVILESALAKIEDAARGTVASDLAGVVRADPKLAECLKGTGWGCSEVLSRILGWATEALKEQNSVGTIVELDRLVLKAREAGEGVRDALQSARDVAVSFAAKRWLGIAARGGFESLEGSESLARVAEVAGIEAAELSAAQKAPAPGTLVRGAETRTKLRPFVKIEDPSALSPNPPSPPRVRPAPAARPGRSSILAASPSSVRHSPSAPAALRTAPSTSPPDPPPQTDPLVSARVRITTANVSGEDGVVRFVGTTAFASGEWIGVELDRPGLPNRAFSSDVRLSPLPRRPFREVAERGIGLFLAFEIRQHGLAAIDTFQVPSLFDLKLEACACTLFRNAIEVPQTINRLLKVSTQRIDGQSESVGDVVGGRRLG
ncbi:hypothetical protein BDK51DRAFT_39441 [Blyttiomyces helicus]|uniref:BTB domain-containing protein n=1 Tax=Blyttiomyces helicus TaxID=388810 RepID=A0A4P9WBS6_9FUNG|nr:hypothetical protein BDK51DRAFT_39441 [Blyttiomyces helicus]|eukprot:RKO88370.1 hypothetical protein BDK51DRAFT_39441 [Blyttiomyces helicus]